MGAYILKRLLLMIPTLFGIMLLSFALIQFAPGGPVERVLAQLQGTDVGATARIGGGSGGEVGAGSQGAGAGGVGDSGFKYRGAQGLDPEFIKKLEEQFGFDKPAHERFFKMITDYAMFDFGQSYFRDVPVLELIKEKLPVSISLGLWLTFVSYAISIPLGVAKAVLVQEMGQKRRPSHCKDKGGGGEQQGPDDIKIRHKFLKIMVLILSEIYQIHREQSDQQGDIGNDHAGEQ